MSDRPHSASVLSVERLSVSFGVGERSYEVVSDVSFRLNAGEALGLVGESGCGKSVTGLSIMGLIAAPGRVTQGAIIFKNQDLLSIEPRQMRRIRGSRIAMVFQDPSNTLNPVLTIGAQLVEQLRWHRPGLSRREARRIAAEAVARVGIADPVARLSSYPHELSGGMRQRVIIAAAMLLAPQIIIADEPTTALDVTVQAQILDLIRKLKEEPFGTGVVLISHDLGVIAQLCERIVVMYAGTMVETGRTAEILARPLHPYTIGLLNAIPSVRTPDRRLESIPGTLPRPSQRGKGCPFNDRCTMAVTQCRSERPVLRTISGERSVACHVVASH